MTPHEERPGSLVKWCGENGERGQRLLLEYRDDEKLPSEVMALSSYNALWRCAECEHEWKAGVCSRTRSDAAAECMRCRGCSARGISFRVWCDANGERGKSLLEEYVDTDRGPMDVTRASGYKALWKCATCEHEWRAKMNNRMRANNPSGCPACSGYTATSTKNFQVWCEENGERGKKLLEEYVDTDRGPTDVTRASAYKALWKCATCEHEWRAKVGSRTNSRRPCGCPKCANHMPLSKTNNFQAWCDANGERGKTLLEEYIDPDRGPTRVTNGSTYKALWKCATCEHEWRTTLNCRTLSGRPTGCPANCRKKRKRHSPATTC